LNWGTCCKRNLLYALCPAALAQRVADERCESLGDVVGYSIRGDSRVSSATCLRYCTTGVLIRRLMSDPLLEGVTHVVLDEVHERNIEVTMGTPGGTSSQSTAADCNCGSVGWSRFAFSAHSTAAKMCQHFLLHASMNKTNIRTRCGS
jgi:hypothetical protein